MYLKNEMDTETVSLVIIIDVLLYQQTNLVEFNLKSNKHNLKIVFPYFLSKT